MSWESLRTTIKTVIDTVSEVQNTYITPRTNVDGYPAVTISPLRKESQLLTQHENERLYVFSINVWYDASHIDLDLASSYLEPVIENITNALAAQEGINIAKTIGQGIDADETIIEVKPVIGSDWVFDRALHAIRQELFVNVRTIYDYTPTVATTDFLLLENLDSLLLENGSGLLLEG